MFFDIWNDVAKALSKIDLPFFYTGHSLGAALATLAASLRPPKAAYLLGAPRVGDVEFVTSLYHTPIYRITNGNDIVTGMPPVALFGYRHVGESPCLSPNHQLIDLSLRFDMHSAGLFLEEAPSGGRPFLRPPSFLLPHAPAVHTMRVAEEC